MCAWGRCPKGHYTAIERHFPYLERGFDSEEAKSVWVLRQVPLAYGAETRAKYETLSAAEKRSPHAVAGGQTPGRYIDKNPIWGL